MCDMNPVNATPAGRTVAALMRLPSDLYDKAQAYADLHYITLGEALRYLLEAGLAAETRAMLESEALDVRAR